MKGQTLNDEDRKQWIDNYEPLYQWWKGSRQSKTVFVRENRAEIDKVIKAERDRPPRS